MLMSLSPHITPPFRRLQAFIQLKVYSFRVRLCVHTRLHTTCDLYYTGNTRTDHLRDVIVCETSWPDRDFTMTLLL